MLAKAKNALKRYVLGFKEGSEPGSNIRRAFGRTVFATGLLVVIWSSLAPENEQYAALIDITVAYYLMAISFTFFMSNVVFVVFVARDGFVLNEARLFRDIIVSAAFSIVAFSVYYRVEGIVGVSQHVVSLFNFRDHLYFSAVTFSTLGYGDFRPTGGSRLMAALQAVYGNIHLGFLVGAAFLAASSQRAQK